MCHRMIDYLHTSKGISLNKLEYVTNGDLTLNLNLIKFRNLEQLGFEDKLILVMLADFVGKA